MHLVEIDPVGLEAAQTALDGGHDPAPRAAAHHLARPHHIGEFGRDHDVLAPRAQCLAEQLLGDAGLADRVRVGGVEQSYPQIDRRRDQFIGAVAIDPAAEIVAAQAHDRHFEA